MSPPRCHSENSDNGTPAFCETSFGITPERRHRIFKPRGAKAEPLLALRGSGWPSHPARAGALRCAQISFWCSSAPSALAATSNSPPTLSDMRAAASGGGWRGALVPSPPQGFTRGCSARRRGIRLSTRLSPVCCESQVKMMKSRALGRTLPPSFARLVRHFKVERWSAHHHGGWLPRETSQTEQRTCLTLCQGDGVYHGSILRETKRSRGQRQQRLRKPSFSFYQFVCVSEWELCAFKEIWKVTFGFCGPAT